MSIILTDLSSSKEQGAVQGRAFYLQRKIQCPANYLIPPNVDVFKKEPVPLLKNCHDVVEFKGEKIHIKKERRVKDIFGRPVVDWKKVFELERKGIVKWPWVTQAFAIEHIFDPKSMICRMCKARCKEGMGTVSETSIGRLRGKGHDGRALR